MLKWGIPSNLDPDLPNVIVAKASKASLDLDFKNNMSRIYRDITRSPLYDYYYNYLRHGNLFLETINYVIMTSSLI